MIFCFSQQALELNQLVCLSQSQTGFLLGRYSMIIGIMQSTLHVLINEMQHRDACVRCSPRTSHSQYAMRACKVDSWTHIYFRVYALCWTTSSLDNPGCPFWVNMHIHETACAYAADTASEQQAMSTKMNAWKLFESSRWSLRALIFLECSDPPCLHYVLIVSS